MNRSNEQRQRVRYPKMSLSVFTLNHMSYRNPKIVIWWSAAIPGFGHLMLGKYLQGFLLVFWEFFTNQKAQLNMAIYYSMTGHLEKAKVTLDTDWISLYIAVYVFTIWDSYSKTNDLNKLSKLSDFETIPQRPVSISPLGVHFIRRYKPWVALLWSAFLPGLGHIYLQRLLTGTFAFVWWIACCHYSKLPAALHLSMTGHYAQVGSMMDPQWLLYMPSLYGFAMFEAYMSALHFDSLYKKMQAEFVEKEYQSDQFEMPVG